MPTGNQSPKTQLVDNLKRQRFEHGWHRQQENENRDLRTLPDRTLAAELENQKYLALEFGVDPVNRLHVEHIVAQIQKEIERRRKLRDLNREDPMNPGEPKKDRDLPTRIRRVHDAWPMVRFLEQMLQVRVEQNGYGRGGQRFRSACPFPDHDDSTPSFVIYPDERGYCFGCHKGGDIIDLTRIYFGISDFYEALERLEATL